jgi:hypothetical protein
VPFTRDPVSRLWDTAARRLLAEARELRGGWRGTRIADPTPRQRAALMDVYGIDVDGPDHSTAQGGRAKGGHGLDAKTRWARGFVRAVYYANDRRHGGPGLAIEIQVGVHKPPLGVIPAGRAVRLRVRRGGARALAAVQRKPEAGRIYDVEGRPAARWADPNLMDWLP